MLKRISKIIILSFGLFHCSSQSTKFNFGVFESKNFSTIEILLRQANGYGSVKGCTIELKSDSTFNYINCGSISKGSWLVVNRTLILRTKQFAKQIDSTGTFIDVSYTDTFAIKDNNEIERILHFKGGLKSYETLIRSLK